MPTKMIAPHENRVLARVLMMDWSGPITYRYNSRSPGVAINVYQGLMPSIGSQNTMQTQAQSPTWTIGIEMISD